MKSLIISLMVICSTELWSMGAKRPVPRCENFYDIYSYSDGTQMNKMALEEKWISQEQLEEMTKKRLTFSGKKVKGKVVFSSCLMGPNLHLKVELCSKATEHTGGVYIDEEFQEVLDYNGLRSFFSQPKASGEANFFTCIDDNIIRVPYCPTEINEEKKCNEARDDAYRNKKISKTQERYLSRFNYYPLNSASEMLRVCRCGSLPTVEKKQSVKDLEFNFNFNFDGLKLDIPVDLKFPEIRL
jgi:hypothetical protein